jgi:hypothetical protein
MSKKKTVTPIVTIDMLKSEIKKIKGASITAEKTGSFKVKTTRNMYYLKDSKKFGFLVGWDEIRKKSLHIENQSQLDTIVAEIREYTKKKGK